MDLQPSILNWSFHRRFGGAWKSSLEPFIETSTTLLRKNGFNEGGVNAGIGGDQDQLLEHGTSYLQHVRDQLTENRLRLIPLLGTLDVHADPEVREKSVSEFYGAMDRAAALGATDLTFNVGIHGRLTKGAAVELYVTMLQQLCQRAEELGQVLSSENYIGFDLHEFIAIGHRLPNASFGYLNDIGNWLLQSEDPLRATVALSERTIHVHAKDYQLNDGIWTGVPLGRGIVPVTEILDSLRNVENDRRVYVAMETDLDAGDESRAVDESLAYFRAWYESRKEG